MNRVLARQQSIIPSQKLQRPVEAPAAQDPVMKTPCTETGMLVGEMLSASVAFHSLHLKVTGSGSFSAHKALGDFYEGIQDHADSVAEQYQGARESLLDIPAMIPMSLSSVDEAVKYLRDLSSKVDSLQKIMPFSEIVNQLDEVKSLIDSTKYKLLFLS
jgi:DNA-binding ferritin-like protein